MPNKARSLQAYEELATWYDRQGQAKLRDWFLVLAADAALSLGRPDQAERLRQRLLHVNPHHLLRPFASFAEALQSPDVLGYVADLRRNYPLETAEHLLEATQKKAAPPPAPEERELKVYRATEAVETPARPEVAPEPPPRAARTERRSEPPESPREERREEVRGPAAPSRQQPTPPPRPLPQPVAWSRPAAAPAAVAPAVILPEPPEDEEGPSDLGFWVSSALFVATLLLGVGFTAYTFAAPLLR
jgi:hypothetical protein